jgi:hypothetical protein
MAFSTNLRGLRSVAMAVLVSSSYGYAEQGSATEVNLKPLEKSNGGTLAGNKSTSKKK